MNIHVLDVTSINLTSVRYCFFKDFAHSFIRIDLLKVKVDLGYNFLVMKNLQLSYFQVLQEYLID